MLAERSGPTATRDVADPAGTTGQLRTTLRVYFRLLRNPPERADYG